LQVLFPRSILDHTRKWRRVMADPHDGLGRRYPTV
jgi:hypothetical protein